MIVRFSTLLLVSSSVLAQGRAGDAPFELGEKIVATKSKTKASSFPGLTSTECNEPCSPSIIARLYHHWIEDTLSLEDAPFTPILYWKDKDRDPISYLGSTESYNAWTCNNDEILLGQFSQSGECRNLAWYIEHCPLSEDHSLSSFIIYMDDSDGVFLLTWQPSSCEQFMGPNATVLEENLPFLEGRVNGTVAKMQQSTDILFPDPTSDSCWRVVCFAQMKNAHDYQSCLEDAQVNLAVVPLESFVQIKDVWCE